MSKREIIRIYTNESVNVAIAEGLRRRGVNAISAKDVGNLGLTDEDQLKYALKEKLVIFTHDDDFLSLIRKSKLEHCGIILALIVPYYVALHLALAEIKAKGWQALVKELGYAGATKFILLYEPGEGNYTEKRKELLKDLTIDEIIREIENKRKR